MQELFLSQYNFINIEKSVFGNFTNGDYAYGWDIQDNENYGLCFTDDGNTVFCICKKEQEDNEEEKQINLKAKFAYDSEIGFRTVLNSTETEIIVFYELENKKRYLKIDETKYVKVPQNAELNINMKVKNNKFGDVVATIDNLKCLTQEKENVKIPLCDFMQQIAIKCK